MSAHVRRRIGGLAVVGGAVVLRPGTAAHKAVGRSLHVLTRRMRYLGGRLQGATYRLLGRRPDPDVTDDVLADRIRSSLGPLERRLDLPRIHVMVEDHVALLHGETTTDADVDQLVAAVGGVSGVAGVESYLHVGLISGDTRPSAGKLVHQPSDAHRRLFHAATAAGVDPAAARPIVRAILATFADRLPDVEREQMATHLPEDVRSLFSPPWRARSAQTATATELVARSLTDLVARIAGDTAGLPPEKARDVTAAVLAELRSLVPDKPADAAAAVLPAELREFWAQQRVGY